MSLGALKRAVSVGAALTLAALAGLNAPARADEDDKPVNGVRPGSFATSFAAPPDAATRKWLSDRGVAYHFIYTNEVLGNIRGGIRRGSLFEGKLDAQLSVDFEKFAGLRGWSFYSNIFQLHRTGGPRRDLAGNIVTISNIEALPTTRLSEIWLEKKFWNDQMSLRVGQLATDQEFFIASFSEPFLSADWPTITAADLPGGGPAYPLATPGLRFKFDVNKNIALLSALLNGSPSPPARPSEQGNRHGLNFRLQDQPFWINEAQWRYNQEQGLAGTLRLGAWHHFGKFDGLRYGMDGRSLGDPLSTGLAARFRGDDGVYAIIDQQIYRPEGGGPESGVGVFGRVSKSMPARQNLIDFYLDGGVLFSGMTPGRPADKFGATFIYAHYSKEYRRLDRDYAALQGLNRQRHSSEMTMEVTYQAQIMPGWVLQPDYQYIMRPNGSDPLPGSPAALRRIKNAQIIGLRSIVTW